MKKLKCYIVIVLSMLLCLTASASIDDAVWDDSPALFSDVWRKQKRHLNIENFTLMSIAGVKWAYFENAIMNGNQYLITDSGFQKKSWTRETDKVICLNKCLADQPRSGGGNCNSCDWWYSNFKCHLSEGTSCDTTVFNSATGEKRPNAFM